jgi:hypothetical protein
MNPFIREWPGRPAGTFRCLDADKIVDTAIALSRRIAERFPQASLTRIASDVENVARESAKRAAWCAAPHWGVRALVLSMTTLGLFLLVRLTLSLRLNTAVSSMPITELLQLIYNAVNDSVLVGVALVFVWTWEARIKRGRALRALHELRSLAHIVDMHQLAKDPESLLKSRPQHENTRTPMTRDELIRYLIYCSDLLALLSKISALFAQEFADPTVLSAVNEIEELSTALSQKIWQKITLVDPQLQRESLA